MRKYSSFSSSSHFYLKLLSLPSETEMQLGFQLQSREGKGTEGLSPSAEATEIGLLLIIYSPKGERTQSGVETGWEKGKGPAPEEQTTAASHKSKRKLLSANSKGY